MRRRGREVTVPLAVLLVVLGASTAHAEVVCYSEAYYSPVLRLTRTEIGLEAVLGGRAVDRTVEPRRTPVLTYTSARGWEVGPSFNCDPDHGCAEPAATVQPPAPRIALSKAEAVRLRPALRRAESIEQRIGAMTEHDGFVWFGIAFYEGEGVNGVGGVGRYDPRTGETIVRRPPLIRDSSVDRIVHDGQGLWLATTTHRECVGSPPTHGLVRYEWSTGRIQSYEKRDDGPCGFTIHDLLIEGGYLWVASDLGLSRRTLGRERWQHFVPDATGTPPMRPTTCETLYTRLLDTLPRDTTDVQGGSHYKQLLDPLKRFRPKYVEGYLRSQPPSRPDRETKSARR
jgi:hypothetical protein